MNWLRRLFGKNKEPAKTEVLEPFPPIDKAHIHNTTRLIEQAETDGANEYPASMSNDESLTEQTIRKKCEERQSEYIKKGIIYLIVPDPMNYNTFRQFVHRFFSSSSQTKPQDVVV